MDPVGPSGPVDRTPGDVRFGSAGDVPVVGDWNGDGVTDLGVVRGSEWVLALGPFADGVTPPVWRDLTFGQPGGVPVVGDWNGDGTDGIGSFAGGQWTLADSVDDLSATTVVTYGAPGDTPWSATGTATVPTASGVVRGSRGTSATPRRRPAPCSGPRSPGPSTTSP